MIKRGEDCDGAKGMSDSDHPFIATWHAHDDGVSYHNHALHSFTWSHTDGMAELIETE
jgi:hypothetical protein